MYGSFAKRLTDDKQICVVLVLVAEMISNGLTCTMNTSGDFEGKIKLVFEGEYDKTLTLLDYMRMQENGTANNIDK